MYVYTRSEVVELVRRRWLITRVASSNPSARFSYSLVFLENRKKMQYGPAQLRRGVATAGAG
jgi:hypothetical protein